MVLINTEEFPPPPQSESEIRERDWEERWLPRSRREEGQPDWEKWANVPEAYEGVGIEHEDKGNAQGGPKTKTDATDLSHDVRSASTANDTEMSGLNARDLDRLRLDDDDDDEWDDQSLSSAQTDQSSRSGANHSKQSTGSSASVRPRSLSLERGDEGEGIGPATYDLPDDHGAYDPAQRGEWKWGWGRGPGRSLGMVLIPGKYIVKVQIVHGGKDAGDAL